MRTRSSRTAFGWLIQIYSIALVVVGVCYKMLLTEYQYEVDHRNTFDESTSSLFGRLLPGSENAKSKYNVEERRQRIAYFFCAGLAVVFACLGLMDIAHYGIQSYFQRFVSTGRVTFFLLLRVIIVLFIGTACFYVTEPELVALVGLAAICMQVMSRCFVTPLKHDTHGA